MGNTSILTPILRTTRLVASADQRPQTRATSKYEGFPADGITGQLVRISSGRFAVGGALRRYTGNLRPRLGRAIVETPVSYTLGHFRRVGPWRGDSLSDFASGFFLQVPHSCGLCISAPSHCLRGINGGVVDVSFSSSCSHSNPPANRSPRCTVSSTPLFSSRCKIFRTRDVNSLNTSTIIIFDTLDNSC